MDQSDLQPLDSVESWIRDAAALPGMQTSPGLSDQRNRYSLTMDAIKSFILQKKLKPGDPLPTELQLCEELHTSRSSIREAVRKLEALRIVSVVHGKGMFVGDFSLDPLVETLAFRALASMSHDSSELEGVVEVRQALDLGVADQVTTALKGTKQPKLAELTDQMKELALQGKTFLSQDIAYHSQLLESVNNPILSQVAHSLWLVHMAVLPKLGLKIASGLTETAEAHTNMLEAALNGDANAYRSAVMDHYRPITEILKPHPSN